MTRRSILFLASATVLAACVGDAPTLELGQRNLDELAASLGAAASFGSFVTPEVTSVQAGLNRYPVEVVASFVARQLAQPAAEALPPLVEASVYDLFERAREYTPACVADAPDDCTDELLSARLAQAEQIIQASGEVIDQLYPAMGVQAALPLLGALLTRSNFLLERYVARQMLAEPIASRRRHHQHLFAMQAEDLASMTSPLRAYCDASARAVEVMTALERQLRELTLTAFLEAVTYHECRGGGRGACELKEYCVEEVSGAGYPRQCFEFAWSGSAEDSAWYFTRKVAYAVAEARAQETYDRRFARLLGGEHFARLKRHLAQRARCEPVVMFPAQETACLRGIVLHRASRFLSANRFGTLALYDGPAATDEYLVWSTQTRSVASHNLCLQADGALQMVSGRDTVAWSAPPVAGARMLTLGQDGKVSYLDEQGQVLSELRP